MVESPGWTNGLLIWGAGGLARESAWIAREMRAAGHAAFGPIGFVDRGPVESGLVVDGLPVYEASQVMNTHGAIAVVAIGDLEARKRAVAEVVRLGIPFATLVHPSVLRDRSTVAIGAGSIVFPGAILSVDIVVGRHVVLGLGTTVSHGSRIEDFSTISPGCRISGDVTIQEDAFLGAGAVVVHGRSVGARSVVGAGAVVVQDIEPDVTAVGVPARVRGPSVKPFRVTEVPEKEG